MKKLINYLINLGHFDELQDKFLEWLTIHLPTIAQLLTTEEEKEVEIPREGLWAKMKNLFRAKEKVKVKRRRINWEGTLMHGAIMKGDAVHDIASKFLVKFMIKKSAEMNEDDFRYYLHECLQP
jgi:23S rRNA maturation-related 3'-5' exoribonuclease YhaM